MHLKPDHSEAIYRELFQVFDPQFLSVKMTSSEHIGHAGYEASGEAGHYAVRIVSNRFERQPLINRHRAVYQALSAWMPGQIHALHIEALTASEALDT